MREPLAFELERFGWRDDRRLALAGRWRGLGGRRIARPRLNLQTPSGSMAAEALEFDDRPSDDGMWTATFAAGAGGVTVLAAELDLGRGIIVMLPPPDPVPGDEPDVAVDDALLAALTAAREGTGRLRADFERERGEAARLRTALEAAHAAIAERDEALAAARVEAEEAREAVQAAQVAVAQAQEHAREDEVAAREQTRRDVMAARELAARDMAVVREEADARRAAELSELREELTAQREAELSELREELTAQREAELSELREGLTARREAELSELRERLAAPRDDAELSELREALSAREAEFAQAQGAVAEAEARARREQDAAAAFRAEVAERDELLGELRGELARVRETLDILRVAAGRDQGDAAKLRAELQEAQDELRRVRDAEAPAVAGAQPAQPRGRAPQATEAFVAVDDDPGAAAVGGHGIEGYAAVPAGRTESWKPGSAPGGAAAARDGDDPDATQPLAPEDFPDAPDDPDATQPLAPQDRPEDPDAARRVPPGDPAPIPETGRSWFTDEPDRRPDPSATPLRAGDRRDEPPNAPPRFGDRGRDPRAAPTGRFGRPGGPGPSSQPDDATLHDVHRRPIRVAGPNEPAAGDLWGGSRPGGAAASRPSSSRPAPGRPGSGGGQPGPLWDERQSGPPRGPVAPRQGRYHAQHPLPVGSRRTSWGLRFIAFCVTALLIIALALLVGAIA